MRVNVRPLCLMMGNSHSIIEGEIPMIDAKFSLAKF